MKSTRTTLAAGVAAKIADSGVGTSCSVLTGLADVYLGSSTVTSAGVASFGPLTASILSIPLSGELWAISAAGGVVSVIQNDG